MLKIPINKNIESYKKEAIAGLSWKEIFTIVLLLVINIGGMVILFFIARIPLIAAIFILFPLDFIVGIIGFFPTHKLDMSVREYIKKVWQSNYADTYYYESSEFSEDTDIRFIGAKEAALNSKKANKRKGKRKEKVKANGK